MSTRFGENIFGCGIDKATNANRQHDTWNHVGMCDIGLCENGNECNSTESSNIDGHVKVNIVGFNSG